MKKRCIERNEYGDMTKWYGFWVCENPEEKSCYIDFLSSGEPCTATLFLDGTAVVEVDFFNLYFDNYKAKSFIHKENEVADHIYKECRKHVKGKRIYIDRIVAENISIAGDSDIFKTEVELDLETFLLEKDEQYNGLYAKETI